jgi:mannose-6-phosphate isomerase-like protein (cupin superfamily)
MSLYTQRAEPAVARSTDNEILGSAERHIRLIMDSSTADGVLSAQRVKLRPGDPGATPHHHNLSAEVFFVLDGEVDILAGDEVISAATGDLLVVPAGMPHAFAAPTWARAEVLVMISPGVDRFDYFRQLIRIHTGAEPADGLLAVQDLYDTYFRTSAIWNHRRAQR